MLVAHVALFFVAPFLVLSPARAILFVAVTQAAYGFYLGVSFLTNHVGMPTTDGDADLGFLRRQVLTSRNLTGPRVTGFLFGGLDSQIEHHLFPTMPRANLRRARSVVRGYCAEQRIPYGNRARGAPTARCSTTSAPSGAEGRPSSCDPGPGRRPVVRGPPPACRPGIPSTECG